MTRYYVRRDLHGRRFLELQPAGRIIRIWLRWHWAWSRTRAWSVWIICAGPVVINAFLARMTWRDTP